MRLGRAAPDLLAPMSTAASVQAGLTETLGRVVRLSGAAAGALAFRPRSEPPIVVAGGARRTPAALRRWLATLAATPAGNARRARVVPPGAPRGRPAALVRMPLGAPGRRVGELVLLGRPGRPRPTALPGPVSRELGKAIDRLWRLERSALRASVLSGLIVRLSASRSLDEVFAAFTDGAAKLVAFDSIGVSLVDTERGEFEVVDVLGRAAPAIPRRDARLPLDGTLLSRVVSSGVPLRIDDLTRDPRAAGSRAAFASSGYRAVALVPLATGGAVFGAVTLASARPGAFKDADLEAIAEIARPLAASIERRRFSDESRRRARETKALLEAGRAVTASLDVGQTIRVILEEARAVLGVDSCSVSTIDPPTNELVLVASLDIAPEMASTVRLRHGEGIAGLAVQAGRPMQSRDTWSDARVRFPELQRESGFRSMLAVPLRRGERMIGAISVFRRDVHDFSAHEEELLVALADQAAIALEHARLYAELEGMVVDRTRELDAQRRFVEVVLETLPLGVFVLDAELNIVRVNRAGARALGCEPDTRGALSRLLPDGASEVLAFVRESFRTGRIGSLEAEIVVAGDAKIFRLTAAPVEPMGDGGTHAVLLIEDVTGAKRLERQMLLMERLTTAGRLAAGVAHELNNPLATIAGCAESLQGRLAEAGATRAAELDDFSRYLRLIEEEAYRCKEITGSLLGFVRDPGSLRSSIDVNAVVSRTVELLSRQSRFADRRVVTELASGLPPVAANEGQLQQVCLGLGSNALEAMEGRGTLTIRSRALRGEVEIEFEDEGPGISPENLSRIFDPFFTTKPPGQGTGLGLAIAQGIVTDHGGRLEVASRPSQGSVFRVVLPL